MKDNYYTVEIRLASKSGWHTPSEARAYYGRYDRNGITIHWWGDGTGASNHDNIVNYFLNQSSLGNKSVNYVLSDNKITMMVNPDNVAWASQAGNPTTVSVEFQPTLTAEGYKKAGWLIDQLEERYGRVLTLYRHSQWVQTACPGTLDLNRMRSEANKWKAGSYTPAPAPSPAPPPPPSTANITYTPLPAKTEYVFNKNARLWKFDVTNWSAFTAVGTTIHPQGEKVIIKGMGINNTLNATYLMTEYSYDRKVPNGFNRADLNLAPTPLPTPPPEPPTPPPIPEPDKAATVAFLQSLVKLITDFLAKFK